MAIGMNEGRWTEVEPSQFAWEREALDFVRRRLPDSDPWRAWSNFTFMDDNGRTAEVDLLVVAPTGVHLVEIKSYPSGRLTADPGTWRWFQEGKNPRSYDNPVLGADSKAKRLKSLLLRQAAMRGVDRRKLWVNAAVFLSSPHLKVELDARLRPSVFGPDADGDQANQLDGLIAHLTGAQAATRQHKVNTPLSRQLAQAMEQADIRQSEKYRRAGSYRFVELLEEGDTWQDFRAQHAASKTQVRARVHVLHKAASDEERESVNRAAEREFRLLHGIQHPIIDAPQTFEANPRGPVTVYAYDPDAVRLDHWLAQHRDLELDDRLTLFRSIAEGVGHAHE